MLRSRWLRRAAILAAVAFGGVPLATAHPVHASGPIAQFTARYTAATVETDPVGGEAAGTLVCGTGMGGDCFNLTPFMGAGLFEVTNVIPDGATDTSTTTVFQGYDANGDSCVACFPGDGDPAWESDGNGVIGAPIPTLPGLPLQVFVRAVSLHDDGALRHSVSGTIVVSVFSAADFAAQCPPNATSCGEQFGGAAVCPPDPQQPCEPAPYPYPSAGGGPQQPG